MNDQGHNVPKAIEDLTLCVGLAHRSIEALRQQIEDLRAEVAALRGEAVLDLDAELALLTGPNLGCAVALCPWRKARDGGAQDCWMASCPARRPVDV